MHADLLYHAFAIYFSHRDSRLWHDATRVTQSIFFFPVACLIVYVSLWSREFFFFLHSFFFFFTLISMFPLFKHLILFAFAYLWLSAASLSNQPYTVVNRILILSQCSSAFSTLAVVLVVNGMDFRRKHCEKLLLCLRVNVGRFLILSFETLSCIEKNNSQTIKSP